MKFLKTYLFFFFVFVFNNTYAQSLNDYRSIDTGNWTTVEIWEVYNGVSWGAAVTYPGQVGGTNDVIISNGVNITINSDITNAINSVTIGDETGGVEALLIKNTSSIITTSFTIAYDGLMEWTANETFNLPNNNTAFVVEQLNPNGLTLGVDHGVKGSPCSASKRLNIRNTLYASCNGGAGAPYNFNQLNKSGGTLFVNPTSNSPVCSAQTVNLNANPGGAELTDTPINYDWLVTPPIGIPYTLTNSPTPTDTPIITGSYTYQVTITNNSGKSNTGSTMVTINNCSSPKTVITNRRITYRVKK